MDRDINFISLLMGYSNKIKVMHWAAPTLTIHKELDDFYSQIEQFKDAIAEGIQSITGQFEDNDFNVIKTPMGSNHEQILKKLENDIISWYNYHLDDMRYEGCRNACSSFLEVIHKYIYLLRLCTL